MDHLEINIEDLERDYLDFLGKEVKLLIGQVQDFSSLSEGEFLTRKSSIFKQVHSLKGGASSFDFYMLMTIFDRFEDLLNSSLSKLTQADAMETSLEYLKIVQYCVQDYIQKDAEIEKYSSFLEDLVLQGKKVDGKILLVDTTKSMKKILEKIASDNRVDLTVLTSGVKAFNRLIYERFDLVIASRNIGSLHGDSLFSAVRSMNNLNKKTPMILISSDEKNIVYEESGYDFMSKDDKIMGNIDAYIKRYVLSKKSESRFKFKNVLFADDDLLIQKIVGKIFSTLQGTNLLLSGNFKESMEIIEKQKPDLIILDYFFKDCLGVDILEQAYKKMGKLSGPILFMTSSPDRINIEKLNEWGDVKGIIEKPIKIPYLLDEINQLATDS